jgi:hypothetical protein
VQLDIVVPGVPLHGSLVDAHVGGGAHDVPSAQALPPAATCTHTGWPAA